MVKRKRGPDTWVVFCMMLAVLSLTATWAMAGNRCLDCHEDEVSAMKRGPHRVVLAGSEAFCTACHTDAKGHIESEGGEGVRTGAEILGWGVKTQNEACLSCHSADFPAYEETPHAGRVSCWECHKYEALHFKGSEEAGDRASAREFTWKKCGTCHADIRSQFRLQYRHPVPQGLMQCTDCHDIHGGGKSAVSLTRGRCTQCHKEQKGPYIFEHSPASRDCTICHRPHGSWNRSLLVSYGNGVCLSCHLQSNFSGVGKIPHTFKLNGGARCWDCHSDVHGSNTTPDFNPRGRR